MSIICEICSTDQQSSVDEPFTCEDGAQLRTHLVEIHSKFVAEALLAPKISDKKHMWLLANVDYSSNTIGYLPEQEDINKDLGETDKHIAQKDEEEANGQSDDDHTEANDAMENNGNALEMLLKGILGSVESENDGTSAISISSEQQSTSAGLANGEQAELDFFAPLKSLLFSTAGDSQQKSGESTPSRAALVDSKAVRKAHCQVCNLDICSTARQRHVYMVHLKKKDLFKCKLCDYTNSNSMWEVQKHCRMQHGSDIRPISQEEKHKLEIQMWSQLCFPEWKQKPQKRKMDDGGDAREEDQPEEKKSRQEEDSDTASEKGNELMSLEDGREGGEEVNNDRLCHLCMEESKYPGRHIAQRHLKQPLYECPRCSFGSYESCTVSKHILKVHPKEASKISPISNLGKYADEIRELQARCFPNRQMKLVRPVSGSSKSRPRERHQCGICGADVAQSDRQRHVFHKHLRRGKIFECPFPGCGFASDYDVHRVKWHIKWDHKDYIDNSGIPMEPVSHEAQYRNEIDTLNEQCFPGWQRKRHISAVDDKGGDMAKTEPVEGEQEVADLDLMEQALKTVAEAIHQQQQQNRQQSNSPSPDREKMRMADLLEGANMLEWTCQVCQQALKPGTNLLRHVAKDHLNLPLYQCPICQNHGAHSAYEVRSHMLRTHGKTSQEPLSSLDEHLPEIEKIWRECFPHKEFKAGTEKMVETGESSSKTLDEAIRVRCRECGQEMKTEDRQIHVYRHHLREPRLYECPACDFSHYACSSDVRNHILRAHKKQPELMPRANLLRYSKEIAEWNERCFPGWINRRLPASLIEDFNSCRLCGMDVRQTSRHIAEHHLHIPLHQCPLCEYGAAEARLVQRHMKNNHTLKECKGLEPIANVEKRRAEFSELHNQCFPGRPKRLSNITIADESRRAKCRGCGMTISKKRRLVHLLEKHLCKPIFRCKYCLFTSNHDKAAVEAHQREKHAGKAASITSNLYRHKGEIRRLATECFSEPNLKLEI